MKRKTVDQALRSIRDCAAEMASSAGDLVHILGEGGTKTTAEVILDVLSEGCSIEEWARRCIEARRGIPANKRRRERRFLK